jgi:hypothetical protein
VLEKYGAAEKGTFCVRNVDVVAMVVFHGVANIVSACGV